MNGKLENSCKIIHETTPRRSSFRNLARVVQKVDNAVHRLNHYPADSAVCFVNTYPMDSIIRLSDFSHYPRRDTLGTKVS